MNSKALDTQPPVIWLLRDDKPGHINQLRGIGKRLKALAGADIRNIDATGIPVSMWRAALGIAPSFDAPDKRPEMIIASGHDTHRLLLALRRTKRAKTVVLMKPGFPLGCVDAVIAPEHDNLDAGNPSVLATEGVINAITPMASVTSKPEALILIGGPSEHFEWQEEALLGQITGLIDHYREWRWTISSSRRTPVSMQARIKNLASLKVTIIDHTRTHAEWLPHQFAASRAVWVTPDSGSMVCEAVTSRVPTGVFELPSISRSQVARGVNRLLENGYAASWTDHAAVMSGQGPAAKPLWEADRAARWLLDTLLPEYQP